MILHQVLTTERVPFSYRVAGLGSRTLAWLLDLLIIGVFTVAGFLFFSVLDLGRPGLGTALGLLWGFAIYWGYFLLLEWLWNGQTVGKRAFGIRVIQWKGTSLTFYNSAVRNCIRFVDSLPGCYGLGFVVAACNRENRRLGDLFADTLVVYVEQRARPIRALVEGGTEADRARLTLWRQRLASLERQQKQTVLDLCLRRDQLRVVERARLFRSAAQYFESRLELTPDECESDEKFVLQLAAVLSEQGPPDDAPRGLGAKPRSRRS
jgi:uncharacterized RDD family membrane protein YckC